MMGWKSIFALEVGDPVKVKLPEPAIHGELSVEEALATRRSVREYANQPLSLENISQLLWAAQGITSRDGLRTAPSAGALYPLEIYLAAGSVDGLKAGVYKYRPYDHELSVVSYGDCRSALSKTALGQSCVKDAPAVFIIAAVYERTQKKYGDRAERYVEIEVGCAVQNIYLQAESLNLGTVVVGAFNDRVMKRVLSMAKDEQPLAVMSVGKKK